MMILLIYEGAFYMENRPVVMLRGDLFDKNKFYPYKSKG